MKNSLFSIFNPYPDLLIALSEKRDGSMKLFKKPLKGDEAAENRKIFLNKLKIDLASTAAADLIHHTNIKIVGREDGQKIIADTDGLLTADKNLFLTITVADCIPVFIYDYKQEAVGLVHAGWRGLSKNIVSLALEKLIKNFNSGPENILIGIGPCVDKCHFEVCEDILSQFKNLSAKNIIKRDKKLFLDIKGIAKEQALQKGVKSENIEINPDCTYKLSDKYFSFRRDKPQIIKSMMAVIGVRQEP